MAAFTVLAPTPCAVSAWTASSRPATLPFQVDLARRAVEHGYTVAEVPIEFIERQRGDSKMSGGIVAEPCC